MRRYPAYRASGVEWLGEVPAGWEVKRLRRFVRLITERAEQRSNAVALENIESWSGNLIESSDADFSGEGVAFADGDILYGKLRPYLAKVGLAEASGEAVGDLFVLRPDHGVAGRYLQYHLLSRPVVDLLNGSTYGAKMPRVSWGFMADLCFPVPPLPEQWAIAAFLDRETAKIDALVAEQRRLVALLREKRQAVISHAVTRGLDPTAPLKPSGVDWLGDVPEGWEVAPLKRLGCFEAGAGFPHEEQGASGEELPFFKVNALGKAGPDGRLVADVDTISAETAKRLRATVFPKGAIVFAKIGAALLLGRVRVLPQPACIDNNMMGFIPSERVTTEFARHLLAQVNFSLIANPGTVPSLNEDQIAGVRVAVPDAVEQSAICGVLEDRLRVLTSMTDEAESTIALLQERRAALISAAVTGVIDVRDALPAEAVPEAAA